MKGENGKVSIKNYYDSVIHLSEREVKALKAIPSYDENLKKLYIFSWGESSDKNLKDWAFLQRDWDFSYVDFDGSFQIK